MDDLSRYNEKQLQLLVHNLLSDPSVIRYTASGKRIQILAPGTGNPYEGPDYKDVAIMLNSYLIIGDAEFHRKSSEWNQHHHSDDENYNRVILHIVLNNDVEINHKFETIVISSEEILNKQLQNQSNKDLYPDNIEVLHQFALHRILRKTAEAKRIIINSELREAVVTILKNFLNKYLSLRRRPVYNNEDIELFINNFCNTAFYEFIRDLNTSDYSKIPDKLITLLKDKTVNIGPNLKREIVLNCILPIALAISDEEARINLFFWYWSTPAITSYGLLKRKFSQVPQNFLWQQQGMLEYNSEYGSKQNRVSDGMNNYGLGEILDFYHIGQNPYIKEK